MERLGVVVFVFDVTGRIFHELATESEVNGTNLILVLLECTRHRGLNGVTLSLRTAPHLSNPITFSSTFPSGAGTFCFDQGCVKKQQREI